MDGLKYSLALNKKLDQKARERFTSSLRAYTLIDLAGQLRDDYDGEIALSDGECKTGEAVHELLKPRAIFKWYSSLRCTAQELVWQSAMNAMAEDPGGLDNIANACLDEPGGESSDAALLLDPEIALPDYYGEIDVHMMPGNYQGGDSSSGVAAGALYDNGLDVFSFGMMGRDLDDIGHSMANYIRLSNPALEPSIIADIGCTIGHNTLPWKQVFPNAQVFGIDIAAPCLRYAHARAIAQGVPITFQQASCEALPFEDNSVDVVFSSMFLHELPESMIRAYFCEAYRVLKPGGVVINMELPPNQHLSAYDAFYLDWDCFYNNEPFYKTFRDLSYVELCTAAGFDENQFFQATMPRFTYVREQDFIAAISEEAKFDEDTGRLSDTITWYAFGAQK